MSLHIEKESLENRIVDVYAYSLMLRIDLVHIYMNQTYWAISVQ